MTMPFDIRPHRTEDVAAIKALYPRAFPEEDLLPLVSRLLEESSDTVLSLIVENGQTPIAHCAWTFCELVNSDRSVALLGPALVDPSRHKQGIGSALIRDGHARLNGMGIDHVYVLGDPDYYKRFGFKPERDIATPYPLPDEWQDAWQSLSLSEGHSNAVGTLAVPTLWQDPRLWGG